MFFLLCLRFHTSCDSQLFLLDWEAIVGTERKNYVYNQDAVCSVEGPVMLLCLCLGPRCSSHLFSFFSMSLCIRFQSGSEALLIIIIIIKHFLCILPFMQICRRSMCRLSSENEFHSIQDGLNCG